jgi:hypothetical protein
MVTLVRLDLGDHFEHAGKTFDRGGMKGDSVPNRLEARQAVSRIFERDPTHNPMDFVPFGD